MHAFDRRGGAGIEGLEGRRVGGGVDALGEAVGVDDVVFVEGVQQVAVDEESVSKSVWL